MGASKITKAFLLCAGKGSRFHPKADSFPKMLAPILDIPLVAFNIYLLKSLGVQELAVNTHVASEELEKIVRKYCNKLMMLEPKFSYEEEPLGSAGGLKKLEYFFSNTKEFLYLNGDSFIYPHDPEVLNNFLKVVFKEQTVACFLSKASLKKEGVLWADEQGRIHSFLKKPSLNNINPYDFSGLARFSCRIFKEIKPDKVSHIFIDVLESLKASSVAYSSPDFEFLDMNRQENYLKNQKKIEQDLKQKNSSYLNTALERLID